MKSTTEPMPNRPLLVVSQQHSPYLNLAVESYLLYHYPSTQPSGVSPVILYLWQNSHTVVIGQNQNPYAECDVRQLIADGGHLLRRRTGGGAVYHDLGNLNFSFITPNNEFSLERQYTVIKRALATFGLNVEINGRNDMTCDGRKFSGSAFSKTASTHLHHGTLLMKADVEAMSRYLKPHPAKLHKHGVASVKSRVVNLSELVPDMTVERLSDGLREAFALEYGPEVDSLDFGALCGLKTVKEICRQYSSDEWLYGKWEQFKAQYSEQYPWGNIELQIDVNEQTGLIKSAEISSDCLDIDVIAIARKALDGASLYQRPAVRCDSPEEAVILSDILDLVYGK